MDTMNQMPYPSKEPQGSFGSILGIIIIVLLLIAGGIYFFLTRIDIPSPTATSTPETSQSETEILRIENELRALESMDDDASSIDAEFTSTSTNE